MPAKREVDFIINENLYSVRAKRVTTAWNPQQSYYVPLFDGKPFLNDEDYPYHWGYDCEEHAWLACEDHEKARWEDEMGVQYGPRCTA